MKGYHYLPSLGYWLDRLYVLDHVRDEYDLGLADVADLDHYYDEADYAERLYFLELGYEDGADPFWDCQMSHTGVGR